MSLTNRALFMIALFIALISGGAVASASSYNVIYTFKDEADGTSPRGLTAVNGILYGVTLSGGIESPDGHFPGGGTVYRLTTTGKKTFLYEFPSIAQTGTTPKLPVSGVINVGGSLYGTTSGGGALGLGSLYKISGIDELSIIYSFGQSDTSNYYYIPVGQLISSGKTIYGVTNVLDYNGTSSPCAYQPCGNAYSVTVSGQESTVASFSNLGEYAYPETGVANIRGSLYGTTCFGGTGNGSVYKILPNGTAENIYDFITSEFSTDGYCPNTTPINVNGTLYGTTSGGGTYGNGTVYEISPAGKETILYSFKGGSTDGSFPVSLIYLNGELYGTTETGGPITSYCYLSSMCGTIFSLTLAGVESVVHFFGSGTDGFTPQGPLLIMGNTFYGTTSGGGPGSTACEGYGCGTVFSFTP